MRRDAYLKFSQILGHDTSNFLKSIYTFSYLRKGKDMKWELLLVDDEPCILDTLAEWLTDDDINVTKAKNGKEGLALLKEKRFDVVVSDVTMPVMDGTTMLREARATGTYVPHIFFSAIADSN